MFDVEAYRLALKRAQALIDAQDESDEIAFADPNGNILSTNVANALEEVGELIANNHLIVQTGERPSAEGDLYNGLVIYDTTLNAPYWCTVPGEREVDTLEVESEPVLDGALVITLNGVDVSVNVRAENHASYELAFNGPAIETGDITLALDSVDYTIGVTAEDTGMTMATAVAVAFAEDPDWIAIADNNKVTFAAITTGFKNGLFAFDAGVTGVVSTDGMTRIEIGSDADTIEEVAGKIRDATYSGWQTGGTGEFVTFTKNVAGICSPPGFDTGTSGVAATFTRANEGVTTVWSALPGYPIVPTGERPNTEDALYTGLPIFDTTEKAPYWCTTPGEREIDTLEILNDVILTGSVDVTLNGVTVNTQLAGDVPAFYSLTINTAPTSAGDVVVTLAGVDTTVAVLAEDPAALVADKIRLAFVGNTDWITLGEGETIGIAAVAIGPSPSGAYTFSGGTTGAASTLGVVLMTPGILADTIPQIATKIRTNNYEGWTTSGEGEFVVFTKTSTGACTAPVYTDVDTGVAGTFVRTNEGVTTVWETLPVLEIPELSYTGVNEETDEFLCDLNNQREINFSMTMTNPGAKAVSYTNWPMNGRCEVNLEIVALADPTISWNLSGGALTWIGGVPPVIKAGKTYRIKTYTSDGGTNWEATGDWNTFSVAGTVKTDIVEPTDLTIVTGVEKTMVLGTSVYDDIIINPSNLRGGVTAPAFAEFISPIWQLSFLDTQTDIVYGSFELPHSYKEGTELEVHVHWSPSNDNTGNCVWVFKYSVAGMGTEVFSAPATLTATDAGDGTPFKHQYASMNAVIPGTGRKIGDIVLFELSRPTGDAFTGNAFLHSVGVHYEIDTLGSRQRAVK